MNKRQSERASFGNMRFIIERQGIYDDGQLSNATCSQLNHLNHEQQIEINEEEATGCLQGDSEDQRPMNSEKYTNSFNISVEEFLTFFNPNPDIDSDPSPKIWQRQAEERISVERQFQIATIEDSGGTTNYHPTQVEESIEPENPKSQPIEKDCSQPQSKDKGYNKNLACYISRSVRRMMFGKFQQSTLKQCVRRNLSYQQFRSFCDDRRFSGINTIRSFYSPSDNVSESEMGQLFRHLYQKILRRSYLRTMVEEGKMAKLDAYIEYKNKYLLNLE